MMKLLNLLIIFLILPFSYAQEGLDNQDTSITASPVNIDKSANWLMQQPKTTVEEAALTVLAVIKSAAVNDQDAIQELLKFKSQQAYCWPSSGCNIKDSSLALLALTKANQAASFDNLLQQEKPNKEGEWLLQIDTQSTGTCNINYGSKQKQLQVENGRIKTDLCPFTTQLDLNTCLEPNLIYSKTSLDISVQCGSLGSAEISLLYKVEDKYFVVGEVSTATFSTLHLPNSNFVDFDSTLFASWALKSSGREPNSILWLRKMYTPSAESSSIMYLITLDSNYILDLLNLQDKNSGSFGSVYSTSLAVLALRKHGQNTVEIEMAKSWLESMMLDDFSWNKNVKDTAMAIYGAFAPLDIDKPLLPSQPKTGEEPKLCNQDGSCDIAFDETSLNCPSDCSCGDKVCDNSEDESSCPEDCKVSAEAECTEDSDCDKGYICQDEICIEKVGHGFFYYFFIIIILLGILGGIAYFYYTRFYLTGKALFKIKKPPAQPPLFRQPQVSPPAYTRPVYHPPVYQPRKTLIEKQLEESLKEAKKLLGKK